MEFLTILILIGLAFIPANIAKKKGYSYGGFWVFGFFLWLPAVIVAACLSDKTKQPPPPPPYHYPVQPPPPPQYVVNNVYAAPPQRPVAAKPQAPQEKICPYCGSRSPGHKTICESCGARI